MRKSILALMSVCLCTFNVWASDINVQTEEVEVTATRTKKVAKEVPMSLSVVGQEDSKDFREREFEPQQETSPMGFEEESELFQ